MSHSRYNENGSLYFPPFAGLKAFYATVKEGSATQAGVRLGISASAVSHQLRNLERELGLRLLKHKKGSIELTFEGAEYFRAIEGAMRQIADATGRVRSSPGRRRVSLTLTPSFAAGWLMPKLRDLSSDQPDIELNLITTTRVVDLERENVDLAIRRGRGGWSGLNCRKLVTEQVIPVLSPDLRESRRPSDLSDAISGLRLLVNTNLPSEWDEWCEARGLAQPKAAQRFVLDSYELSVQAARDGLGIALGRRPIIDPHLADGSLVPLLDDIAVDDLYYFIVWPAASELSSTAKRVRDWLLLYSCEKNS